VPVQIRIAMFRVFQECLNNARHHAQAHGVVVLLDVTPKGVHLEVRDDGVGFVVPRKLADLANGGHSGLLKMRERIEAVGGNWRVLSQPGQGTRIVVDVPLAVQDEEGV
jgi:signal transduction histidine kinase